MAVKLVRGCAATDAPTLLRVEVVGAPVAMAGRHWVDGDTLWFEPHFPFQPGIRYRATASAGSPHATLLFSPPQGPVPPPPAVSGIHPSAAALPENLLRFYVRFATPMRRGDAAAAVAVLDGDGRPAPDVLYRAPVELWDGGMRVLTVLLDPGRLKRGVGPNRALGPPLAAGQSYTLAVGAGMTDRTGQALHVPATKRFRVTPAIRQRVDPAAWGVASPQAGGRGPLVLSFSRPLDWAMLFHAMAVRSADGRPIPGRIRVGRAERRWRFVPDGPWLPGRYAVTVDCALEDPCGNTLLAPFDRPARLHSASGDDGAAHTIPFAVTEAG